MKMNYIIPETEELDVSQEACFVATSFPSGSGSTGGTENLDVDGDEIDW